MMKKLFAFVMILALALSVAACVFVPAPAETIPNKPGDPTGATADLMKITVTVVHADGSSKDFSYETDAKNLGTYLEEQGLIASEGADDGMFHTVDGEKADWNENQSYWAFYLGEEYAMTGIYDTPITDGMVYKLVYSKG